MTFDNLNLNPALLRAVREKGYTQPTPIQTQAIPPALEGRDVLGCAQTGTGKTAAFALPILHRLWKAEHARGPRPVLALVLAPTRELATQIDESFRAYGKHSGLKSTVVFGGVGYDKQRSALKHGVDIVVATPGRLLDLMKEGVARFDQLQVLVLDEADRMLDMGFLPDVKRVLSALPKKKQTLCFSATMPPEIQRLVDGMLHSPAKVAVAPVATTAEKVEQAVYFVDKNRKADLLIGLLKRPEVERALVFTRTKRGANRLATKLSSSGVPSEAIHGNKSQNARERALASFKTGRGRVLVATDIAARGIDVSGITHVINFELPNEPETYVHRIGRTARANASGVAWSLCGGEEREYLRDIERLIRQKVPVASGESASGGRRVATPGAHGTRAPQGSRSPASPHVPRGTHAPRTAPGSTPRPPEPRVAAASTSSFGAGVDESASTRHERAGAGHERSAAHRAHAPARSAHGASSAHGPRDAQRSRESYETREAQRPRESHGSRGSHGAHAPRGPHEARGAHGGRPTHPARDSHASKSAHAPRSAHGGPSKPRGHAPRGGHGHGHGSAPRRGR